MPAGRGYSSLQTTQQEAGLDATLQAEGWRLDLAAQPNQRPVARAHTRQGYVKSDIISRVVTVCSLFEKPWKLELEQASPLLESAPRVAMWVHTKGSHVAIPPATRAHETFWQPGIGHGKRLGAANWWGSEAPAFGRDIAGAGGAWRDGRKVASGSARFTLPEPRIPPLPGWTRRAAG